MTLFYLGNLTHHAFVAGKPTLVTATNNGAALKSQ